MNEPLIIFGSYSRDGYRICLGNEEIYSAGNSRLESQSHAQPGSAQALSLRELRRFCWQTAQELASERGATSVSIEREEEIL